MKPYDNTVTIRIADLHSYRPIAGPVPPAPIAPHAPPASAPPFAWQEVARIQADRLRASWELLCSMGARAWAMGVSVQEVAERTVTLAVPTITRRRRPWRDRVALVASAAMGILLALALMAAMTNR